ncbi:MAG: response regulator [Verrucomicrobiae bacterium]|nr:response regulator [Verrucomicrobiae bacterium]
MKQKIFVIEDHPLMRRSLVEAIEREADLTVCGEAEDAQSAVTAVAAARPDLVLTDLQLKASSGLDFIKAIRVHDAGLPVVATTMFNVQQAERLARAAGATAFVTKQDGPARLIEVMRRSLGSSRSEDGAGSGSKESTAAPRQEFRGNTPVGPRQKQRKATKEERHPMKTEPATKTRTKAPPTACICLRLTHPTAQQVCVAGSFNDWQPDATPMTRRDDGQWVKELTLPPGRYEYRLIVDGEWADDPAAAELIPNAFGTANAVLVVSHTRISATPAPRTSPRPRSRPKALLDQFCGRLVSPRSVPA